MYDLIKNIFQGLEVRYRFKPKWLRRMELDVYVPKVKLGFEYQGQQHFKPIELFGGEQAFIEQVKRDALKKKICADRGIEIIYVYYDEELSEKLLLQKTEDMGLNFKSQSATS